MSKILFAWEIGGGLGHLANMLPLANALRGRGHSLTFALRERAHAAKILGDAEYSFVQAPFADEDANITPSSYAEILLSCGYADVSALGLQVEAWRSLLMSEAPALLIADHAPTALLAARGLPMATAILGAGFFSPPLTTPLPVFRTWESAAADCIVINEKRVLDNINQVLAALSQLPLPNLADLLKVDRNLLCTWPELDHYPNRSHEDYLGPVLLQDIGTPPVWPATRAPRIFAYLKGDYPHFEAIARAIRSSGMAASIYLHHGTDQQKQRLSSTVLHCQRDPMAVGHAIADADLVICHAGPGTVAAALLAGKPLLLLPMQAEQYITARRVLALGAGQCHVPKLHPLDLTIALRQLINKPEYRHNAKAFAEKYVNFNAAGQTTMMVDRLENLFV